jgi:hypothetical protein
MKVRAMVTFAVFSLGILAGVVAKTNNKKNRATTAARLYYGPHQGVIKFLQGNIHSTFTVNDIGMQASILGKDATNNQLWEDSTGTIPVYFDAY